MRTLIVSTDDWHCAAELQPISSAVGGWYLAFRTRWLSARDPEAEQTALRLCLTEEGLRALAGLIDQALESQSAQMPQGGRS